MTWAYTIETGTMETQPLQETACWETTTTAENRVELCYNWNRYYDPGLGMYISVDKIVEKTLGWALRFSVPHPDSVAAYGYASQNPKAFIDPMGLYRCTYSISNHTMSCTPNNPGNPPFNSNNFTSGNNINNPPNYRCVTGDCRDNPNRTSIPFSGPIPVENYTILPPTRAGGSRRNLVPDNPLVGGRNAMQIHGCSDPNSCSQGCIAATTNADRDLLNELLGREEGNNRLEVRP